MNQRVLGALGGWKGWAKPGLPGLSERDLSEFRPGVLAIQHCPPSPAVRRLLWLIVTLFFTGSLWAVVGKVDIVAVAHGRVIPSGHSKPVQALVSGEVSVIYVREGQRVRRDATLIALDATVSEAEEARLGAEHRNALERRERNQKLLALLESDEVAVLARAARDMTLASNAENTQNRLLRSQLVELANRLTVLDGGMARQRETLRSAETEQRKLELILPLVGERAAGIKRLVDQRLQGRHAWFDVEQERISHTQNLELQRIRLAEIQAEIRRLASEREALRSETRTRFLEQLSMAEQQVSTLTQELVKVRDLLARHQIRAPVDGVVQQLSVHAPGAAVSTGATLMVIVPETRQMEIEANLPNKDVGFVRVGQIAEIKVETFPFTRYGTVQARVLNVSGDAVVDAQGSLFYSVRLGLVQPGIRVDGRLTALSPGMGVVAEIGTGQRRIIDYLLSPLLRYRQEAMRER